MLEIILDELAEFVLRLITKLTYQYEDEKFE